ncbi:MAG: S46 family peptidase [Planctomycetota bacterium]
MNPAPNFVRVATPMVRIRLTLPFPILLLLTFGHAAADEGMFPVSQLGGLGLQKFGMELSDQQIFSGDKVCQIDGICKVNGCTGSFVSADGLIITNHHCAYRAIQSASTAELDLLENGFHAGGLKNEILAKGYTVRVTESFRDVSDQVLAVVNDSMSALERAKAIERQIKAIEKDAEERNPSIRAEVAEMFIGETYLLFEYTYLRDVRLVFAPPSSVGNFGGEIDNWEWPRHTGDFSFMRAYTAPDGSSADYSPDNIPYRPKKFLQVSARGVDEGDFVFLLGYPGRTARHKTAAFLEYERDVRLPAVVENYSRQMAIMQQQGEKDRAVEIKHASRMRSLANVEKRSRGQLKGLRRAQLAESRREKEQKLQAYIDADPGRKKKYGTLLTDIEAVYQEMQANFEEEFEFQTAITASRLINIAHTLVDMAYERAKPDLERESPYMDRNLEQTLKRLRLTVADLDLPTDIRIVNEIYLGSEKLGSFGDFAVLAKDTGLDDLSLVEKLAAAPLPELKANTDPLIQAAFELHPETLRLRELGKQREGELTRLYGELIDVKKQFSKDEFVPDANATLRLTHGNVKGYSPGDAVMMRPITTLRGVAEKTTGRPPFVTPAPVMDAIKKENFGPFRRPDLDSVPVAILYDTDTTGGNSGSPIMNGKGELVGVNFDRAFEATINDFAWNESYSRSIGVDIRYVLWITGVVYEAKDLMREMRVAGF